MAASRVWMTTAMTACCSSGETPSQTCPWLSLPRTSRMYMVRMHPCCPNVSSAAHCSWHGAARQFASTRTMMGMPPFSAKCCRVSCSGAGSRTPAKRH